MSRSSDKRRLRKYRTQYIPPPSRRIDLLTDQEEMQMYIAIQRFNWMIREVKKQIYRKPSYPFKPKRKSGKV